MKLRVTVGTQFLWRWNKGSGSEGVKLQWKEHGADKNLQMDMVWGPEQGKRAGLPAEYVISQMLVMLDHLVDMKMQPIQVAQKVCKGSYYISGSVKGEVTGCLKIYKSTLGICSYEFFFLGKLVKI